MGNILGEKFPSTRVAAEILEELQVGSILSFLDVIQHEARLIYFSWNRPRLSPLVGYVSCM